MHLNFDQPIALAFLAASALHVEAETPSVVAAHLRRRQACEQVADDVEHPCVGRGIAARCPPDGRLVDDDDLVQRFLAANLPVRAGAFLRAMPVPEESALENVDDQRGLSRTAHARDAGEGADGDARGDVLKIVLRAAHDFDPALLLGRLDALLRNGNHQFTGEILGRERMGIRQHLGQRPRRHQFASAHARAGAEVEEVIRLAHGVLVVLDHDHGIPDVTQMPERVEQTIVVALVQADARFVEDVEHAHETRANLGGEPDTLRLAAAERAALAIQSEVAQADVVQEAKARTNLFQRLRRDFRLHLG